MTAIGRGEGPHRFQSNGKTENKEESESLKRIRFSTKDLFAGMKSHAYSSHESFHAKLLEEKYKELQVPIQSSLQKIAEEQTQEIEFMRKELPAGTKGLTPEEEKQLKANMESYRKQVLSITPPFDPTLILTQADLSRFEEDLEVSKLAAKSQKKS